MPITSEDIPDQGPNASMQFGEGTENARLQREIASRTGGGAGRPPQPPAPPTAAPSVAQPPVPVQSPPTDGIPRSPDGRLDMNQVFMNTQTVPTWRQQAQTWASAPGAGRYLRLLGKLSTVDIGK